MVTFLPVPGVLSTVSVPLHITSILWAVFLMPIFFALFFQYGRIKAAAVIFYGNDMQLFYFLCGNNDSALA